MFGGTVPTADITVTEGHPRTGPRNVKSSTTTMLGA